MYFGHAETDEHVPANVIPTLKSGLDKAGTRYGLDVFPNSRHGFQFPERDAYETHAAEESWSKVVAMWDRNLKSRMWDVWRRRRDAAAEAATLGGYVRAAFALPHLAQQRAKPV